ncbi:hypothetical protein DL89DRAFT_269832, partial [Linderina pennispora]
SNNSYPPLDENKVRRHYRGDIHSPAVIVEDRILVEDIPEQKAEDSVENGGRQVVKV